RANPSSSGRDLLPGLVDDLVAFFGLGGRRGCDRAVGGERGREFSAQQRGSERREDPWQDGTCPPPPARRGVRPHPIESTASRPSCQSGAPRAPGSPPRAPVPRPGGRRATALASALPAAL